jgi:hypothetical protein
MTDFEETREYKLGRSGEEYVAGALRARGHYVTDTAMLRPENGHGPRIHGRDGDELIPADLDVQLMPWRYRVLIQVKTKTRPDMGRITGELEHGFAWRDWLEYRTLEQRFGSPVFLVIAEVDTRKILAQRIGNLRVRGDCPTLNRGQQMAYFPRSQFAEDGVARMERCAEHATAIAQRRAGPSLL